MKKVFLYSLICAVLFSCTKSNSSTNPKPQTVTGGLYYSNPASDGGGLYFITDSTKETLWFYDNSGDHFNDPQNFKDSINAHLRFTFLDEGRRGCPFCQVTPPLSLRIVRLVSFVKD